MASQIPETYPRSYSIEEILSLRSSLLTVNSVIKKLSKHPDIAGIFKIHEEPHNEPESFTSQSKSLVDVTNRRKVLQLGNKHTGGGSSEESGDQGVGPAKLPRETQRTQWHLRRRDSSNRSSQPYSAPSGVAAQQSENFQRFYRAVVSPTHVRVTAGGRIVPNTRPTAPPQFDWNPDKLIFEPRKPFSDTELNTLQTPTPWSQNNPKSTLFPQLFPAGFLPPYNVLPSSNSLALAAMSAQNLHGFTGNNQDYVENGQPLKESSARLLQGGTLQQPLKISPPSQFDHSKPFMFNGQVVYPVPAGFQPPPNAVPLPITVLGNPNFPHECSVPPAGSFLPAQFPVPIGNLSNPIMMPPGLSGRQPMVTTSGIQPLESFPPLVPYLPMSVPGMTSLSELTKLQIQGFRNQVKHIDNQLANNRHQIDELFLHRQRSDLIVFIEKMEAMLKTQLTQEGNGSSAARRNDNVGEWIAPHRSNVVEVLYDAQSGVCTSNIGVEREGEKPNGTGPSAIPHEDLKENSTATLQVIVPPVSLFVPTVHQSTAHHRTEDAQVVSNSIEGKQSARSEPTSKSRLTAAAAMAPPFQPRAHAVVQPFQSHSAGNFTTQKSSFDVQPGPLPNLFENQAHIEARLLANSSSSWGQTAIASGAGHASLPRAHTLHAPYMHDSNYAGLLKRSNTMQEQPTAQEGHGRGPIVAAHAEPYLVGVLPQGMHQSEAKGTDFVYSRPLAPEEIRARHLYWGDAPRSTLKGTGLPKFDGKDFYPPSPVKAAHQTSPSPRPSINCSASPVHLPNFERLFTEPGVPGYKTPQVRPKTSLPNLMPTPTQLFLENGIIGFKSPSPRPATYRFEAAAIQNWSTKSGNNGDSSQKLSTPPAVAVNSKEVSSCDFSQLFLEPGVASYNSPPLSGLQHSQSRHKFNNRGIAQPVTPKNIALKEETEGDHDETGTLDSWGAPKNEARWVPEASEDVISTEAARHDSQSEASTVEIRLTPQNKEDSPKRAYGSSFGDQVTNLHREQQTLFLQNMLRNTTATKAAPALSGPISSATAQGYLPQYRGSAAASLAPAMLSIPPPERDDERPGAKIDPANMPTKMIAPLIAANFLEENRPLNRDRPRRPIRPSSETMGAEEYMRYLSQRAQEDKKILEQGWNSKTTGTGPVMGSDW